MTPPGNLTEGRPGRIRLPFYLQVLIFGLIWLAGINALRLVAAVRDWAWLGAIGVKPGALYIAITGGVFALIFLAAAVALLARWRRARRLAQAAALGYAVWMWVDRLVVAQSQVGFSVPYALAATVALLAFTFAALEAGRDALETS